MTEKNVADLTTDNTADITSATNPDSITPAILGARRKDVIDSFWNKLDGITIGTVTNPLTIPESYNGLILPYGTQLDTVIQRILENNDLAMGNVPIQGRPGLFLATITPLTKQTFRIGAMASATVLGNLSVPNDSTDGGFDNGNNWSTFSYKVKTPGFTGRFILDGLEIELMELNSGTPGDTLNLRFQVQKNGANYGGFKSISFIDGTHNVGDKLYVDTLNNPPIASAPDSFSTDDIISIQVLGSTGAGTATGVVRVNAGIFSNQDI